ncbi:tyrosine-type recombinase/integrase [Halopiger xanaduensis]|uniref:Integrase family protein n=1 Tax=Halopiger xanaduensis (strain DSM 18323 / JCM 14033 / SH-6) TaxID=797210 RepID=F8D4R8_HALXS|nr:site-specific integrase [Halopiger xanaduensis]AEH37537.1 integrase family protein [Halopiger xanaduensis SH-6]
MDELEPIGPDEALQLYLDHRRREVSESTLRSHRSRLGHFIRWCNEEKSIDNLNELTGRNLHEFRLWRTNMNGGIAPVTEKTQMDTLRVFIRFLETIDAVRRDLSEKVMSPDLEGKENVRDVMLNREHAEAILDHLSKYEYASRAHIVLALQWHTMLRRGAVRAADLQDYHSEDQCLEIRHRPETGTPLKNQEEGERMVALSAPICDLLDDWIDSQRPEVVDEYGRDPLVSTKQGRIHPVTVTSITYARTRPCDIDAPCPLNRDPDECEAGSYQGASKCPESVSSHAVRRGAITYHLQSDVPTEVVAERANVGANVLEKHYDQRSEKTKMEQRRKFLRNL